jgi:hypothetical protein
MVEREGGGGPPQEEGERPAARFPLGEVVATPGALDALDAVGQDSLGLLLRHSRGDWGDLEEEDRQQNELSLTHGLRLVSAYTLESGVQVWVITEADRSATTILLPEDY